MICQRCWEERRWCYQLICFVSVEVLVAKSFLGQITQCYGVGVLQSENLYDFLLDCLSSHHCFAYLAAYLWVRKFCWVSYCQSRGCISQLPLDLAIRNSIIRWEEETHVFPAAMLEPSFWPCKISANKTLFCLFCWLSRLAFSCSQLGWSVVSLVRGN